MPIPRGADPATYDRCVSKVKRKGRGVNPYAICGASVKRGKRSTKRSRRR